MHINLAEDDQITPSLREFSILVALAGGPSNGYQIAIICAHDAGQQTTGSRGSLVSALKRLERFRLIGQVEPTGGYFNPGKPQVVYALTPTGRMVLEWHADSLEQLVRLTRERLQATEHTDSRPAAPHR